MTLPSRISCTCETCRETFFVKRATFLRGKVRFCSRRCLGKSRVGAKNSNWRSGGSAEFACQTCGVVVRTRSVKGVAEGRRRFCSLECASAGRGRDRRGEGHPLWKGGRQICSSGYVLVYAPDHHRAHRKGYVFEHILVAERATGRSIRLPHVVHHVNGDRQDNRPENLALLQDETYHMELHARLRVKRAGGDPFTQRICGKCGALKSFDQFHYQSRAKAKRAGYCIACCRIYLAERNAGEAA